MEDFVQSFIIKKMMNIYSKVKKNMKKFNVNIFIKCLTFFFLFYKDEKVKLPSSKKYFNINSLEDLRNFYYSSKFREKDKQSKFFY